MIKVKVQIKVQSRAMLTNGQGQSRDLCPDFANKCTSMERTLMAFRLIIIIFNMQTFPAHIVKAHATNGPRE